MHFSLIDFLILIIMAWCIVSSARRGFVKEVFGLASVVVGLLIAAWFYQRAASAFKDVVRTENLALFLAFSVIFIGVLVIGTLVIWLTTRFMKFAKLQPVDRILGAAFGFIRGWVFATVLLLVFTAFDIQNERMRNSGLAPYFLPGSRVMAVLTPYDLKARFLVGYRGIERWWREQR